MNLFRRQVLKLKLIKLTNDVRRADCFTLTKQFNDVYKMVDSKYIEYNYSICCTNVSDSFDKLSDSELDKTEEMLRLF